MNVRQRRSHPLLLALVALCLPATSPALPSERKPPAGDLPCDADWNAFSAAVRPRLSSRGFLGMVLRPVPQSPDNPTSPELLVVDMVLPNSPAEGVAQPGDLVLRIGDLPVEGRIAEATELLRKVRIDDEVSFEIRHGGQLREIRLKAVAPSEASIFDGWTLGEAERFCGGEVRERLFRELRSRRR